MTKEEYIEHCRALFENPLMGFIESVQVSLHGEILVMTIPHQLTCGKIQSPLASTMDGIMLREWFEQGGKYYKENQNEQ